MFALVCALFGLIIGSFLNVLILRHGVRSLDGRSACFSCGGSIAWYDNIPLFSFLILRGRCRHCRARISLQYPLVELGTALCFATIGAAAGLPFDTAEYIDLAISFALAALLIAIFVYDLRHTIIPDSWVYPAALLAFAIHFFEPVPFDVPMLALAGPVAALPLFTLWLVSRGRWMGLGDSKLALAMGWLLGPIDGITAVLYAFVIGAVVSIGILLPLPWYRRVLAKWGLGRQGASQSFTMKSEVPFGPFLITSCIIVWLMHLYHVPLPL